MGIFQQQFNSLLGSAMRTHVAGSVKNVADNWIEKNTGKNWDPKTNKTSQDVDEWSQTGLTLDEASIVDDVLQAGLRSMPQGDVRDAFEYGVKQARSTLMRKQTERQMALETEQSKHLAFVNKLNSQGYAKMKKTIDQERKRLTGGKE